MLTAKAIGLNSRDYLGNLYSFMLNRTYFAFERSFYYYYLQSKKFISASFHLSTYKCRQILSPFHTRLWSFLLLVILELQTPNLGRLVNVCCKYQLYLCLKWGKGFVIHTWLNGINTQMWTSSMVLITQFVKWYSTEEEDRFLLNICKWLHCHEKQRWSRSFIPEFSGAGEQNAKCKEHFSEV